MLSIRLSRRGRVNKPSYYVVVADKSSPVKGKYIEKLGFYNPLATPKELKLETERIEYWVSKGARPSDTAASLFKSQGVKNMDQFIAPRDKKKTKKNPSEEA